MEELTDALVANITLLLQQNCADDPFGTIDYERFEKETSIIVGGCVRELTEELLSLQSVVDDFRKMNKPAFY